MTRAYSSSDRTIHRLRTSALAVAESAAASWVSLEIPLPFDHRSSFEAGLLDIRGRQADPQEVEQLAGYKRVIYEGFLEALEKGSWAETGSWAN